MLLYLALLLIGGFLLYYGGDWIVDGAKSLAEHLEISAFLVAIIIIGFGTSAPELFVSLDAVWVEKFDISMGDVVGSNIANFLLVLAIAAIITPVAVSRRILLIDGIATVAAMTVFLFTCLDGTVQRWEAAILLVGILAFLYVRLMNDRKMVFVADDDGKLSKGQTALFIVLGLIALPLGARLFVNGAVGTAEILGIPEAVIGLSVVAIGTSLPELATCVNSAFKRHTDMAVGNILGSNMFNSTIVIGGASLLNPIQVSEPFLSFGLWIMMAVILFSLVLMRLGYYLSRRDGLIMFTGYLIYLGFLIQH